MACANPPASLNADANLPREPKKKEVSEGGFLRGIAAAFRAKMLGLKAAGAAGVGKMAGLKAAGAAGVGKMVGVKAAGAAGVGKMAGLKAAGAAGVGKMTAVKAAGAAGVGKMVGVKAAGAAGVGKMAGLKAAGAAGVGKMAAAGVGKMAGVKAAGTAGVGKMAGVKAAGTAGVGKMAGVKAAGAVGVGKMVGAKTAGFKGWVAAIGQARPLAFTSEIGVAAKSQLPLGMYYGAWGLSGLALSADIATRCMNAPEDKKYETAGYWTLFHIPASLVIPAFIIHKVVHYAERAVSSPSRAIKYIPKTARPYVPVACALLAIVPVVPACDHLMEMAFEPTLGKYLGLEFEHHGHHGDHDAHDADAHDVDAHAVGDGAPEGKTK